MFIFLRLICAHLLADFALQTDYIYHLRIKYSWGVVFHSLLFALFSIVFLAPYLSEGRTWFLILILWGTHTVLDKLKINYIVSTGEDTIWWFLVDQLMHVMIIAGVCLAMNSMSGITLPLLYQGIYGSDLFFKFANAYVFALFAPTAIIYYIEKTAATPGRTVLYPTPFFKYTGVFERMAVLTFLIAGTTYYFFVPVALFFSWYLQKNDAEPEHFLVPRMALSLTACAVTSYWLLAQLPA